MTTKLARKWDGEKLDVLRAEVADPFWPFEPVWKEDLRETRRLFKKYPELATHLGQALTLKPAKPTVKIVEE